LSFLRNHYEKIILAVFLLVFIASLVWLITTFSKSMEITRDDLKLDDLKNAYEPVKTKDYQDLQKLDKQIGWEKAAARMEGAKNFTDLLIPFKISPCKGCKYLIPRSAYTEDQKCPLCGVVLIPPKDDPPDGDPEADNDDDGIPDIVEVKLQLNPRNADDAYWDKDDDGFSNIYEYEYENKKANTDITDPKIHPPLAFRIHLTNIRRTSLPIRLKKVIPRGEDKEKWEIQVDVLLPRGWRTRFPRLGDVIKLNNDAYKIIDVAHKMEERFNRQINDMEEVNASEIVIQKEGDKPISVPIGKKQIFENKVRISLRDIHNEKLYKLRPEESFNIGEPSTGIERYLVDKVDIRKKIVIIKNGEGIEFEITRKPKVGKVSSRSADGGPSFVPGGGPEGNVPRFSEEEIFNR